MSEASGKVATALGQAHPDTYTLARLQDALDEIALLRSLLAGAEQQAALYRAAHEAALMRWREQEGTRQ